MNCLVIIFVLVSTLSSIDSRPAPSTEISSIVKCFQHCGELKEMCFHTIKSWTEKVVCVEANRICNRKCKLNEKMDMFLNRRKSHQGKIRKNKCNIAQRGCDGEHTAIPFIVRCIPDIAAPS